jgi:hypothetical protein
MDILWNGVRLPVGSRDVIWHVIYQTALRITGRDRC